MGPDAMILGFWMLSFKPTFSLSTFTFIKRLFSSFSFSAITVVSSAYLRLLIFLPAILIPTYPILIQFLSLYHSLWRRWWHPTPVLLPGKSCGQRSLVGCSPWGHEESDMTEQLPFHFSLSCIGEGNGNPLQCSCLENTRDGGAWWAAIYRVTQSLTRLKWLSSITLSHDISLFFFLCNILQHMISRLHAYLTIELFSTNLKFHESKEVLFVLVTIISPHLTQWLSHIGWVNPNIQRIKNCARNNHINAT